MQYEYWQTCDYGREGKKVNLTKSRLGEFFYYLFKMNGETYSTYVMRADIDKCYIQFAIKLPKGRKEEFERTSGFALEPVAGFSPC